MQTKQGLVAIVTNTVTIFISNLPMIEQGLRIVALLLGIIVSLITIYRFFRGQNSPHVETHKPELGD